MACEVMLPIQMLTMINTIIGENIPKPKWLFSKKVLERVFALPSQ
jgi:hypothetical protein